MALFYFIFYFMLYLILIYLFIYNSARCQANPASVAIRGMRELAKLESFTHSWGIARRANATPRRKGSSAAASALPPSLLLGAEGVKFGSTRPGKGESPEAEAGSANIAAHSWVALSCQHLIKTISLAVSG